MNKQIRLVLALAASVAASSVFAGDANVASTPDMTAAQGLQLGVRGARAAAPARAFAGADAKAKAATATQDPHYPAPTHTNAFRAYPPSCASDPLPTAPSGDPQISQRIALYGYDYTSGVLQQMTENVQLTIWRIACSSSGLPTDYNPTGAYNALTLMRIQRDATVEGNVNKFPFFPKMNVQQGTWTFDKDAATRLRAAIEPNTSISETLIGTPIVDSTTYVLENYPYSGSAYYTFSDAFILREDPQAPGYAPSVDISVPLYDPTPNTYPDAFNPLPIDGYLTSAYYDPAHSGEGLLLEVFDNGNSTNTVFASWYTYDALGLPFWLIGQGVVPAGGTSLANMPVYYYTGGGFAGDFGAGADGHDWGTMSISFPSCREIDFDYTGQTDDAVVVGGPAGSGSRQWKRLSDINGFACE